MQYCRCGQLMRTSSSAQDISYAEYDEYGRLKYAICVHGMLVFCDESMDDIIDREYYGGK